MYMCQHSQVSKVQDAMQFVFLFYPFGFLCWPSPAFVVPTPHLNLRQKWLRSMDGKMLFMANTPTSRKPLGLQEEGCLGMGFPLASEVGQSTKALGGPDCRPQHYVEISRTGDTWLFAKDGALACMNVVCFPACCLPGHGVLNLWQCHHMCCTSTTISMSNLGSATPRTKTKVPLAKGCACCEDI